MKIVSNRLRRIFFVSLGLIYLHGIEEVLTGFQFNDSFMVFFAGLFDITPASFYWISHIIWWVMVPLLYFVFRNNTRVLFPLLALFGLVFVIEIHHLVKGLIAFSYYPGAVTAFFYTVVGYFYWKQVLRDSNILGKN